MDSLYDRQRNLPLQYPLSIAVVGLGGIGAWVAQLLAMSGVTRLLLYDYDQIEQSNLNRLPFPAEAIGRNKAEVVAEEILRLRPSCRVGTFGRADDFSLGLEPTEVLVDCTDRTTTHKFLHDYCTTKGTRYVRGSYDGLHFTVSSNVSEWSTDPTLEGYAITPSWVAPSVIAAAQVVNKVMHKPDLELCQSIDDSAAEIKPSTATDGRRTQTIRFEDVR